MDTNREPPPPPTRLDRRALLARAAGLAVALSPASLAALASCAARPRGAATAAAVPAAAKTFDAGEWRTLAAALERLLPSAPGEPGAREVNAIGYLDAGLVRPDVEPEDLPRMRRAAERLDALAKEAGSASFADLPEASRDAAIARLQRADPEGKRIVERLLYWDLEAFLCDPAHGGNSNEVAWAWLGHAPGDPRIPKYGDARR